MLQKPTKYKDTRGDDGQLQMQSSHRTLIGGDRGMNPNSGLAILFLALFPVAHMWFGDFGLVVLPLLVLLGITHPIWLLLWKLGRNNSDREQYGSNQGEVGPR